MIKKCGLGPANYAVYKQNNNLKAKFLIDNGLRPTSSILDAGCGAGGLASSLKSLIGSGGSYTGFDISQLCIQFCRKAFTGDLRFTFQLFDVRNNSYNPKGTILASQLRFPYPDNSFDYVALFSVFTHMIRADVRHYLTEIRRVLKDNGKCAATFFVWDLPFSQAGEETCSLAFRDELDGMIVVNRAAPEQAVAFRLQDLSKLFERTGFRHDWAQYGNWRRPNATQDLHYQDIFLLEKPVLSE